MTIYRLVMQDSIEERILALHRDKRDLAADLLEGTETTARLSEDAFAFDLDPDMIAVCIEARQVSHSTGCGFDPTLSIRPNVNNRTGTPNRQIDTTDS